MKDNIYNESQKEVIQNDLKSNKNASNTKNLGANSDVESLELNYLKDTEFIFKFALMLFKAWQTLDLLDKTIYLRLLQAIQAHL